MWTASAGIKSNFKAICNRIRMPCDRNLLQETNFMHGHWKYAQPEVQFVLSWEHCGWIIFGWNSFQSKSIFLCNLQSLVSKLLSHGVLLLVEVNSC